ncbi:MAG: IclR family transcriptional regulator [Clostridia bacterium]|nr:IclR family transcriptional regulator [Clostridia bacterium]
MHQPTKRVLEILEAVARDGEDKRLVDFSRELGIPKSTLLPILQTLCRYRYLLQTESGQYRADTALFSLGAAFAGNFPTLDFVRKQLEKAVEQIGETCYFGVLEKGDVLYIEKVDSPQPLRILVEPGRRLPAYATAIGKALLSERSEGELRRIYPEDLAPVTEKTVTDIRTLAAQLMQSLQKGYFCEIEESTAHIRCFAVPIRKGGRVIAAISVAIPIFRFEEEKESFYIETLQNAAAEISRIIEETDAHFGTIF